MLAIEEEEVGCHYIIEVLLIGVARPVTMIVSLAEDARIPESTIRDTLVNVYADPFIHSQRASRLILRYHKESGYGCYRAGKERFR